MNGVKIKQLEWHNFDAWTHWAEGACGTYHVEERNGYWQVELRVGGLVHGVTKTDDTTPADLEAAKAAAQQDYENRILAALDTPAPALMDELVEALRPFCFFSEEEPTGNIEDAAQHAWEMLYRDRFKDWVSFEDIVSARAVLAKLETCA